ncbi:MAG: ASKHA domain-containing protein [Candidatus Omnitrophica bacterium]|nr:ASKHA domain-containing protein [Candidatus Omnitrophota bacterium]
MKITFYPANKSTSVEKGASILSAALSAGIPLNASCGGDGVCGKCRVILKKGEVFSKASSLLTEEEKNKGVYLACLTSVMSDAEVEIPSASGFPSKDDIYFEPEIRDETQGRPIAAESFIRKVYLEQGLIEELHKALADEKKVSGIPQILSKETTITLAVTKDKAEVIRTEPGDSRSRNYGFAFDIGTTTVCGRLVDLNSGKTACSGSSYNMQVSLGSDIITRIVFAGKGEGLRILHESICGTVNRIIRGLADRGGINLEDVSCIVCSGNTTMIHFLLNKDPSKIRKEPCLEPSGLPFFSKAGESGITIGSNGLLVCLPGVSGYLGGDAVSGVLSCAMYRENALCALVDIGTNGEIILGNRDFLVGCAASAGPAFEGSGLSCGMRAEDGAIESVSVNKNDLNVSYSVIGKGSPKGICGSGYISLLASMLDSGLIDKNGRIKAEGSRIRPGDAGKEFVICLKEETGADIFISEADIDNLKRSKAAIYSAAAILARHLDLNLADVSKFFVSGGFGSSLDIEKAVSIGLLPDVEKERFVFIGNSSLSGATRALLSSCEMCEARAIASRITYFDLSSDPEYMDEYGQALFFPHTDLSRFSGKSRHDKPKGEEQHGN